MYGLALSRLRVLRSENAADAIVVALGTERFSFQALGGGGHETHLTAAGNFDLSVPRLPPNLTIADNP